MCFFSISTPESSFLKDCRNPWLKEQSFRVYFLEVFMFNDPLAFDYTKCPHNALTGKIIGAAIEVHRTLGPGLLESAYEACLVFELQEKGLNIVKLDSGYRLDLIVETKVLVEVK